MFRHSTPIALAFLLSLSLPFTATAQEATAGDRSVLLECQYVVQGGDTLERITQRYLGDAERWRENWRLNPELQDPNRLNPGQIIKILVRQLPEDGARLAKRANRVENEMRPRQWATAQENNILRARDSLRTHSRSSAELVFSDDTQLTVSEESLIFLDRLGSKTASVEPDQIEIVTGQADFSGTFTSDAADIELILGDATAIPKASADGKVQTRARRMGDGSQLMVYAGDSSLNSGGTEIEVPQGMGSNVAKGKPPAPPEKLLEAPHLMYPEAAAQLMTPRPKFRWQAVDGAVAYVLEICNDAQCGSLVNRVTEVRDAHWQPADKLPIADFYWRVTAVSPSGLDGYPATAQGFAVLTHNEDEVPPEVNIVVSGPHVTPMSRLLGTWLLGPGATLQADVQDTSEIASSSAWLDGENTDEAEWQGPWDPGHHSASFSAIDVAGNRGEAEKLKFIYDTSAPGISWGVEGLGEQGMVPEVEFPDLENRPSRAFPSVFGHPKRFVWKVDHDQGQILLRPRFNRKVKVNGQPVKLTPERGLWVLIDDDHCWFNSDVTYDLELIKSKSWRRWSWDSILRIEATDCVGNRTQGELQIER